MQKNKIKIGLMNHAMAIILTMISLFIANIANAETNAANQKLIDKKWITTLINDWHFSQDEISAIAKIMGDDRKNCVLISQNMMRIKNPDIMHLALWIKYRNTDCLKNANLTELASLLSNKNNVPEYDSIKKSAEIAIASGGFDNKMVVEYFNKIPPESGSAKLRLAIAKSDLGSLSEQQLGKEIRYVIQKVWSENNLGPDKDLTFISKYNSFIRYEDTAKKVNDLLWQDRFTYADKLAPYLDDDYKKLFYARLAISKNPSKIDDIFAMVPTKLQHDEGLLYEIVRWLEKRNKIDAIIDIIAEIPATSLHHKEWWKLRNLYAREAVKLRRYSLAYNIASGHGSKDTLVASEGEWLAGWIALRFLVKPDIAYKHFTKMYDLVKTPVSVSRAAYWAGRAAIALDNPVMAKKWYSIASSYPTMFYGQMAIVQKYNSTSRAMLDDGKPVKIPGDPEISGKDLADARNERLLKMTYLSYLYGSSDASNAIVDLAIDKLDQPGKIAIIINLASYINRGDLAAKAARSAMRRGILFFTSNYQIIPEVKTRDPLVYAIIKQESAFDSSALSKVGAAGLMQLMPQTANLVARELGVDKPTKKRLFTADYNVTLGAYYIKKLLDDFNGSKILAIASYNGGAANTKRWLNGYYDPRKTKDIYNVIDWIELIGFGETRNYVQRVSENMVVYSHILAQNNSDKDIDLHFYNAINDVMFSGQ